ncbi:MAG: N-formylglutamate deformylase [Gammaproteobacteria bacterium]|nr:N-formylglutamate deformylase [Gammaproteobacteria bacterium]MDH5345978.1 N-formylglutamate deformylase [Gammaproteobacteria bacterium]
MSRIFDLRRGSTPLLVSIPHDGRLLAPGMATRMTDAALRLPDTDWHVRKLYEFAAGLGAGIIAANFSRYVVDLNRSAEDAALYEGQVSTGLCPSMTFAGEPVYRDKSKVTSEERDERVERYWRPYHDALRCELDRLVADFGYALLWDGHSIRGDVPRLFEGTLPDLNLGTNGGASLAPALETAVAEAARRSGYSSVVNGRFRGGFITRHYGNPQRGVQAIQLELAQRNYMDEESFEYRSGEAGRLAAAICGLLESFMGAAAQLKV